MMIGIGRGLAGYEVGCNEMSCGITTVLEILLELMSESGSVDTIQSWMSMGQNDEEASVPLMMER